MCGGFYTEYVGVGTEQACEMLRGYFPHLTVEIFDADHVSTEKKQQALMDRFLAGNVQMLVVTELIFKYELTGVVDIAVIPRFETLLSFPDFSTEERALRTIRVLGMFAKLLFIQAANQDHPLLRGLDDLGSRFQDGLALRKALVYPPFVSLLRFHISIRIKRFLMRNFFSWHVCCVRRFQGVL
jgi:primosomal protein N'